MGNLSLLVLVDKAQLSQEETETLLEKFKEYEALLADWKAKDDAMVIKDVTETDKMAECAEALKLVKLKYKEVEKLRKDLGEESLRKKQAIDKIGKYFKERLEPLMESLSQKANFAEIARQKALDELAEKRLKELEPYGAVMSKEVAGTLSETAYQSFLETAKIDYEKRGEEKRKEQERLEKEKKELENLATIKKELEEEKERVAKLKAEKFNLEKSISKSIAVPTISVPTVDLVDISDMDAAQNIIDQLERIEFPSVDDKELDSVISNLKYDLEIAMNEIDKWIFKNRK